MIEIKQVVETRKKLWECYYLLKTFKERMKIIDAIIIINKTFLLHNYNSKQSDNIDISILSTYE